MKTRTNLKCYACGWKTSRGVRPNTAYGKCPKCGSELKEQPRRHFGGRR